MKVHVFIATTQGVVAIQDIEAINDADIMSVVCLDGTANTLNISQAYHSFVKKGSGIIQQDFGGCSYRIDLDAKIDQGNSWQLGVYLAHQLKSQHLLSYGDISQGDKVLCITGELNIKTRQITPVQHLDKKLKLAANQAIKWQQMGAECDFIMPEQADVKALQARYRSVFSGVYSFAELAQAQVYLPCKQVTHQANKSDLRLINAGLTRLAKSGYLGYCVIFLLVLLMIYIAINSSETTLNKMASSNQSSLSTKAVSSLKEAELDNTRINSIAEQVRRAQQTSYLYAQVRAKTHIKLNKAKCQVELTSIKLDHQYGKFNSLDFAKTCSLFFVGHHKVKQVFMVSANSAQMQQLKKEPQGWQVDLKQKISHDLNYYFLSFNLVMTPDEIEKLAVGINKLKENHNLNKDSIEALLALNAIAVEIYQHTLTTF